MITTFDEAVDALNDWSGDANLKAGLRALSPELLTAIAFGRIDAVALARAEMAKRGLDAAGKFIGFAEANKNWGSPIAYKEN